MDRFDERDTIFSRMELVPGSDRYQAYYARRPELKQADDQLRNAPPGLFKSEWIDMAGIDSTFRFLKELRPLAEQSAGRKHTGFTADEKSLIEIGRTLRKTAIEYGAVLYGEAVPALECFYSVRGRGDSYGRPVTDPLRNVLVFAVEMDREKIFRAPKTAEAKEVTRGYVRAVVIGLILSYFLRELGFEARCHTEGETELILPAAAQAAGLGGIGRIGLLLTEDYGPMIRLGAVTTNYPVLSNRGSTNPDRSRSADFCNSCDICARHCPGGAISRDPASHVIDSKNGSGATWKTDPEACFRMWKKLGTDCGICVALCPYGK